MKDLIRIILSLTGNYKHEKKPEEKKENETQLQIGSGESHHRFGASVAMMDVQLEQKIMFAHDEMSNITVNKYLASTEDDAYIPAIKRIWQRMKEMGWYRYDGVTDRDYSDEFSFWWTVKHRTISENLRDLTPLRMIMRFFEYTEMISTAKKVK
jgi:hypothetical protein